MATKLENLTTKLQAALDAANALPDAITLDELTNPGSAATMLEGTEMLDAEGKKVTGTMADWSLNTEGGVSAAPDVDYNTHGAAIRVGVRQGYYDGIDPVFFETESVSFTPTKETQTKDIVEEGVFFGEITVNPIPDEYQNVSNVTATAARTAAGDVFVDADGVEQTGTLNVSSVHLRSADDSLELTGASISSLSGEPSLHINEPDLGEAERAQVLAGATFSTRTEFKTTGTMPNNGSVSTTIDGLETKSVTVPKGYTDGGTIALDSTIDDTAAAQAAKIAEIEALLEGKSLSGGTSVETCTVTADVNACTVYYTTVENSVTTHKSETLTAYGSLSMTVVKNSIVAIAFTKYPQSTTVQGGVEQIYWRRDSTTDYAMVLMFVTDDGSFAYYTASGGAGEK